MDNRIKCKSAVFKKLSVLLFFLLAVILPGSVSAEQEKLTTDPLVRHNIDRQNWEPGGKYFGFPYARGTVSGADSQGRITLLPAGDISLGSFSLQTAVINGDISYITRFQNHSYHEHSPFDDVTTSSDSAKESRAGGGQVNYALEWQGKKVHPADAYDGQQGGGYPAPAGARDEYSYHIEGIANGIYRVNNSDYGYKPESMADRIRAMHDYRERQISDAENKFWADGNRTDLGYVAYKLNIVNNVFATGLAAVAGNTFGYLLPEIQHVSNIHRRAVDYGITEGFLSLDYQSQYERIKNGQSLKNGMEWASATLEKWKNQYPDAAVYIDSTGKVFPFLAATKGASAVSEVVGLANTVHQTGKLGGPVVKMSKIKGMSWSADIQTRGLAYERWIQSILPEGTLHLSPNHPAFDHFIPSSGKAISTKTMDTAGSYKNPKDITKKLDHYIDEMTRYDQKYKIKKNQKNILNPSEIKSIELQLGVPYNTPQKKIEAIKKSVDYANKNSVNVVITEIK